MMNISRVTQKNKKKIRLAVSILAVAATFVLFGVNGEKDGGISVERGGENTEAKDVITEKPTDEPSKADTVTVDISGQVSYPGIYTLDEGSRLGDLCEQAGGLTGSADIDAINRAAVLTDGQKVYIPERGEALSAGAAPSGSRERGLININTADAETLQDIPGVGPVTALHIIEYREEVGSFEKIEDIKNVSGIGEKTFQKMKDAICI